MAACAFQNRLGVGGGGGGKVTDRPVNNRTYMGNFKIKMTLVRLSFKMEALMDAFFL